MISSLPGRRECYRSGSNGEMRTDRRLIISRCRRREGRSSFFPASVIQHEESRFDSKKGQISFPSPLIPACFSLAPCKQVYNSSSFRRMFCSNFQVVFLEKEISSSSFIYEKIWEIRSISFWNHIIITESRFDTFFRHWPVGWRFPIFSSIGYEVAFLVHRIKVEYFPNLFTHAIFLFKRVNWIDILLACGNFQTKFQSAQREDFCLFSAILRCLITNLSSPKEWKFGIKKKKRTNVYSVLIIIVLWFRRLKISFELNLFFRTIFSFPDPLPRKFFTATQGGKPGFDLL